MKTKPDKQIWRLMKPYADKIRRRRCWLYTMRGICVGITLAVILNLVAFLIPINHIVLWSLGLMVFGGLLGYLFSIVFKEKISQMVRKIDEFGLDERVQTMWELSDVETNFAVLQRQDTIQRLQDQKINLKKQSFSFPKQYRWICGIGLLIIILCLIIPNPQRDVLAKRRADQVTLQEQAQLVEDMRTQLNQDDSMDQAVKQELNIELQKLAEKLRKEKDLSEGIKQLSQTQKKIEELRKETETENQQLSDALKERNETRSLGNYLQDGSNEALRQWEKQAETKQTAEALREAAENTDNQEAKEKLEEMAKALEAGENEKAEALANQLKERMNSGLVDNDSNISNATFGQLGDQLNIAKGRMTQSNKKASDAEGRSQKGKSDQSDSEGGQNSKSASSSGQSKGNKQGQGNGQGSGNGESSEKGQGPSSNKSGGKGAGNGSGALKDFEKIYDATRLGGEGQIDQIEGQIDENGESMQGAVEGMGNFDGYIPYDEVVGEYGEEAVQGAQRENLPPAAQDWVQGYFEALQ